MAAKTTICVFFKAVHECVVCVAREQRGVEREGRGGGDRTPRAQECRTGCRKKIPDAKHTLPLNAARRH